MLAMILLLAAVSAATAEDAPAMWMEQNGDDIDLMVNTSINSSGISACVHYEGMPIDITNVSFEGSPWQPLTGTGWSHHTGYISFAVTEFDGVVPGEYKVATFEVECLEEGVFAVWLLYADVGPEDVTVYDLNYTNAGDDRGDAVISIGNGTGTTTLPIMITDAENVGAVDITLKYDPAVVTVTDVYGGDMDCTYTNLENVDEGWIRVGAVQGDNPGMAGEFTLLNINFSAVSSGTDCPLELTVTTYKDATPNCTAMTYVIRNGVYTSSLNGDANGDGVVDIADAMYIAKHVIGIAGYETIDEYAADVNGDGMVDMSDSMYLTKHVLGMDGFEELR